MSRGNVDKVMKDSKEIVRLLKDEGETLTSLQKRYRCTYATIIKAVYSQLTKKQWLRVRRKILSRSGIKSRFRKGHVSEYKVEKGVHMSPATEFHKGHLPSNHKHTGTVTIRNDKCGKQYRWIKVSGLLQGKHKWIPYARYVWTKENGPVPDGLFVAHLNGDTLDDSMDNFRLMNRQEFIALMKKRNPNWKKKAIRSYKKTVRLRRKRKAAEKKHAEKNFRKIVKFNREELKNRKLLEDHFKAPKISDDSWWECIGCGYESRLTKPPLPCPKCQGLRFDRATLLSPRRKVIYV